MIKILIKHPNIVKIWHLDSEIFEPYVGAIKATENLLEKLKGNTSPGTVLFSLAPPMLKPGTQRFDPDEPFNVATKRLYDHGAIVVVAVGNSGNMGDDTLNPWSVAPWVIGVGAVTKDGKKLADFSSKGIANDQSYKPTVVGPGVDMITTHPSNVKKTDEQIEKDRLFISEEKMKDYTVVTGTSFAAANIAGAINCIIGFLQKNFGPKEINGVSHVNLDTKIVQVTYPNNIRESVRFRANVTSVLPGNIKYILKEIAIPMPQCKQHEVGAGFMSRKIAEKIFGKYEINLMGANIFRNEPW